MAYSSKSYKLVHELINQIHFIIKMRIFFSIIIVDNFISFPIFTLDLTLVLLYFIFNYALQPLRLIVRSELDVPTFATRRLLACHHAWAPSSEMWNYGWQMSGKFCLNAEFHVTFRDILHAVKLRHGTDGFTSPPKEGVLRIFFALKIRRLQQGVNPRTWVPKTSTLPLDH